MDKTPRNRNKKLIVMIGITKIGKKRKSLSSFSLGTGRSRVEINCFQTLVMIPLNRAVVFPIPEIAVASSANPNFIHKDQPRIIGFDED